MCNTTLLTRACHAVFSRNFLPLVAWWQLLSIVVTGLKEVIEILISWCSSYIIFINVQSHHHFTKLMWIMWRGYVPHTGQHCPVILTDFSQPNSWISQSNILWHLCFPASHLHCRQIILLLSTDCCSTSALSPSWNNRPFILQLRAGGFGLARTEQRIIWDFSGSKSNKLINNPSEERSVCVCNHVQTKTFYIQMSSWLKDRFYL